MSIKSESQFLGNLLMLIVKSPFYLIMSVFNQKYMKEALKPITFLFEFICEAKVTFYLIVLNILVFLYQVFFMSYESLIGVIEGQLQLQIFPIIASWFLHGSVVHLLGNMLALFVFGRVVERKFSPGQYLMVYFGSAVVASFFSLLFQQPGIGASGAIAGIIATGILINPFYITYIVIFPLPILVIGWIAIIADVTGILVPQIGDNVGHFAHLGGYVAISLAVFFFSRENKAKMKKGLMINIIFVVILLLLRYFNIINL